MSTATLAKLKKAVAKSKAKKAAKTPHYTKEQVDKMLAELPPAYAPESQKETLEEAGRTIRAVARAFRMRFNDVGKARKIKGEAAQKLAESVDCDPTHLRLTKLLYAKHPSIQRIQAQKAKLSKYWQAKTLKYPEEGVRLFGVRGETEEEQNEEVRLFLDEINDLVADFRSAIDSLANSWDDVMSTCRERLRELHDPRDYPSADQLHNAIGVDFSVYNFELPDYLKAVNPAEYRRQQERLQRKFTEVAEKQAALMEEAMAIGLQQMVSSIRGWQDGKQKSFKDGVISKVFAAINEYKTKIEPFGIMAGRQIGKQFDELHALLKGVGGDAAEIASTLRKDKTQREFVMGRVDDLFQSILGMSSETTRRKVLRPGQSDVKSEEPEDAAEAA
jgi:hypothetical protein